MSRDIRSYFNVPKAQTSKLSSKSAKPVILSDEDEEVSSQVKKKVKVTEKKRRKHALSDSEDEETAVKKTKNEKKDKKAIENHKEIHPSQVFGKAPLKREAAPEVVKKSKKIKEEEKNEIGFHDDDLDSSLLALDESVVEETLAAAEVKEFEEKKIEDKESRKRKGISRTPDSSPDKKKVKNSKNKKNNKHSSNLEIVKQRKSKLNESADMFEEVIEKKKQSAALYQQFLHRGGARNPGSKEIPEGAEFCLAGLSFLLTGVYDSLERDETEELIKKYGGRVLHSVSRKTDYVIVGEQPGPAKISKAESMNIPMISEDDFLNLIRTRPAGKNSDVKTNYSKPEETKRSKSPESELVHPVTSPKKKIKIENSPKTLKCTKPIKLEKNSKDETAFEENKNETLNSKTNNAYILEFQTEALVEKYRPQTMKQLIGQQGEKSNAKKLYSWLSNWYKNRSVKHSKPSPWAKNDNGAFFKAALLSGPPGIGKTTTVYVATKELGFDLVEFNASDTRNKKLLKDEVSTLLSNTSVKGYFISDKEGKSDKQQVLLMDEVDGMAGNEDRGGLQELIALIKSTDVPIICICNDRNNPKMRTLSNYTYDLRFQKPRIEQIKGAMMSLCFKENIKIKPEELQNLIESTNHDIRQVINHLALLSANIDDEKKTKNNQSVNKDLKLGPWDVVRKVFSAEEHKKMSIHDKSNLFFQDYSLSPLFVQENYLSVTPRAPRNEILERVAKSAESLCFGDLVENCIRTSGSWSLLPTQAMYSSVIPGTLMSGNIIAQINFPSWLGRNSKKNKMDRLLQEITVHSRLTTGASKEAINLDYLPHLRRAITNPLIKGDVETAINVMNQYHLIREDLDSIIEVSLWPGNKNPMQFIETKAKTAFTKAYNKNAAAVPYAINLGSSKKRGQSLQDEIESLEDEEIIESEEDDEEDLYNDKMIKAKKSTSKKTPKDEEKALTSKKIDSPGDEEKHKRGKYRGKGKKDSS